MKLRTLSAAALLATLALGTLVPTVASAAPTELGSNGSVTVEEGTAGGGGTETTDPEEPDTKLPPTDPGTPEENTNQETGALVIEKTTDLEFGTIETAAADISGKYAAPMSFEGGAEKRGAYVQWADVRSGGRFGYTVNAQLTKQFTSGSNVLGGSTISFANGLAVADGANTNLIPANVATGFTLSEAPTDKKTVVTASQAAEEGKGRFIMSFGQSTTSTIGTPGTEDKSVELKIPAGTASNMAEGTYEAEITWTIEAAP